MHHSVAAFSEIRFRLWINDSLTFSHSAITCYACKSSVFLSDSITSKEQESSKSDGNSTANSDHSSHQTSKSVPHHQAVQPATSNSKLAKNKKNRTNKLEKDNSQLGRKEKNRDDKKTSVATRPMDDLKNSELKSSPSAKRKGIYSVNNIMEQWQDPRTAFISSKQKTRIVEFIRNTV